MSTVTFDPNALVLKQLDELLDELDETLKSDDVGAELSRRGVNISLALTAANGLRAYLTGDKMTAIEDLQTAAEEIAARSSKQ
jgi:hypothetical protein